MSEQNLTASINEAKDMAKDLSQRVHLYKEATLDPDATISVPDKLFFLHSERYDPG